MLKMWVKINGRTTFAYGTDKKDALTRALRFYLDNGGWPVTFQVIGARRVEDLQLELPLG